jgi:hypothetical protein
MAYHYIDVTTEIGVCQTFQKKNLKYFSDMGGTRLKIGGRAQAYMLPLLDMERFRVNGETTD